MIRGVVNQLLQPEVEIAIRGSSGCLVPIKFKFDTGFNGELALGSPTLKWLEKSIVAEKSAMFGNGQVEKLLEYEVECLINDEIQLLRALDLGQQGSNLIGMRALTGWTGCVEFRVNGDVKIENRS